VSKITFHGVVVSIPTRYFGNSIFEYRSRDFLSFRDFPQTFYENTGNVS
jgi:hypothetical protein